MKLIFFVIAFCLASIRVYFSWAHHGPQNENKGDIVITADGLNERMEWLGEIRLNEEETGIAGISPGGYVKYVKNDTQFVAESNVKGIITYEFPDHKELSDSGKALVMRQAIHELVSHGFNAKPRMERLYRQGGYPALIREWANLQIDYLQQLYLERIMQSDSLSAADVISLTERMRHRAPEEIQGKFLSGLGVGQLDTPAIRTAVFQSIDSMQSSIVRRQVLGKLITKKPLSTAITDGVLASAQQLPGDLEKQDLYHQVIDQVTLGEDQWNSLLIATGSLTGDLQKSELLINIAKKMPRSQLLVLQYRSIAKSISSDFEYGKAIRAID
jgi:hypothetical protein